MNSVNTPSPKVSPKPSHPSHPSRPLPAPALDNRRTPDPVMKLALRAIDPQGLVHVTAEGSITAIDFPTGSKDPFETLLGAGWKNNRVVLDFVAVTYIDSSAVGWLIGAHRAFKEGGGRLVVHSVQPTVRQILDVLKVGRVVPLADNEAAARALAIGGAL